MAKKSPKPIAPVRALARGAAKISPRHGVYVFCEGRVTEPEYISAYYRDKCKKGSVILFPIMKGMGVPLTIVESCVKKMAELNRARKIDSFENNTVWAVFDVDIHPKLDEAIALAQANGVQYVISNPCVEVWGLMHNQTPFERPVTRHEAQAALSNLMPGYHHDKSPVFPWPWCSERVERAMKNAAQSIKRRESEGKPFPAGNPATNFHDLLNALSGADDAAGKK
jgi:RloB-like protein